MLLRVLSFMSSSMESWRGNDERGPGDGNLVCEVSEGSLRDSMTLSLLFI